MLSFVIIGKNEGWKLTKCIKSVLKSIESNNVQDFEIIYVDSKSTDDSIQRAKEFNQVKTYKITGASNAAIARNIGAQESNGEYLFFIDGDMEILPDFFQNVFSKDGKLLYECVTGHIDDIFYDQSNSLVKQSPRTYKKQIFRGEKELISNGGIFLIKRKCWQNINGMKTKFRRSQDVDLTLRLLRNGIVTIRVPSMIAYHHTIDYRDEKRMWQFILNGNELYPAVLFRDHISNLNFLGLQLRSQYTAILLFVTFILNLITFNLGLAALIIYFTVLNLKVYFNTKSAIIKNQNKLRYYLLRLSYQISRDLMFIIGSFFFYPTSPEIEYVKIS